MKALKLPADASLLNDVTAVEVLLLEVSLPDSFFELNGDEEALAHLAGLPHRLPIGRRSQTPFCRDNPNSNTTPTRIQYSYHAIKRRKGVIERKGEEEGRENE